MSRAPATKNSASRCIARRCCASTTASCTVRLGVGGACSASSQSIAVETVAPLRCNSAATAIGSGVSPAAATRPMAA